MLVCQNNTSKIYAHTNGVASKRESNRSRKPPCPGIICPLSFTLAILFNLLSSKSPAVPITVAIIVNPTQNQNLVVGMIYIMLTLTTTIASKAPPAVPSQVFFGEIDEKGVLP